MTNHLKPTLFSIAAALTLSFSSCQSDDVSPNNEYGEERMVSLRFTNIGATTRAVSAPQDGVQVQFNRGDLYLVTDAGIIQRHFHISECDSHRITGCPFRIVTPDNPIYTGDLEEGVHIEAVPGSIRRVYVVGNSVPNAPSGMISTVNTRMIDVFNQYRSTDVNMWGVAVLEHVGISPVNPERQLWAGTVSLRPTVARIEVSEFRGEGRIRSFTVAGIFIDRYFRQAQVSGTTPGTYISREFTDAAERATFFRPGAPHLAGDVNNAIHDVAANSFVHNGLSVTPPTDRVWSYNLFAVHSGGTGNHTRMPAIVVRLTDVVVDYDGVEHTYDERFITIVGMRDEAPPHASRPGIQAGNVYRMRLVRFTDENLTAVPYERYIDANVHVTLAHWNEMEIRPPGFRTPSPVSVPIACNTFHTFDLGAAVCGDCANPVITYQWQQSLDGGRTWMPARAGVGNNTSINFTTFHLKSFVYFRRRATCRCGNNAPIYSQPARVSPPCRLPASDFPDLWVNINGVRWSTRNVDLSTSTGFAYHPADAGMFFQWGRNVGWRAAIYPWGGVPAHADQAGNGGWTPANAPLQHWNPDTRQWVAGGWDNTVPNYPHWLEENDPCRQIRPIGAWRMPTSAELQNLGNAARGRQFVGTFAGAEAAGMGCWQGTWLGTNSENPIYLPTTSFRVPAGGIDSNRNLRIYLWGREIFSDGGSTLRIVLRPGPLVHNNTTGYDRRRGHNVRCVRVD